MDHWKWGIPSPMCKNVHLYVHINGTLLHTFLWNSYWPTNIYTMHLIFKCVTIHILMEFHLRLRKLIYYTLKPFIPRVHRHIMAMNTISVLWLQYKKSIAMGITQVTTVTIQGWAISSYIIMHLQCRSGSHLLLFDCWQDMAPFPNIQD